MLLYKQSMEPFVKVGILKLSVYNIGIALAKCPIFVITERVAPGQHQLFSLR